METTNTADGSKNHFP